MKISDFVSVLNTNLKLFNMNFGPYMVFNILNNIHCQNILCLANEISYQRQMHHPQFLHLTKSHLILFLHTYNNILQFVGFRDTDIQVSSRRSHSLFSWILPDESMQNCVDG